MAGSVKSWSERLEDAWLLGAPRRYVRQLRDRVLARGRPGVLHYFHRVDDPYSQLMAQILPELMARYKLDIQPHVVERLPAQMYPEPQRYEAYSILDAARLARLYGLGFSSKAMVTDRLAACMAGRHLATLAGRPTAFFEEAQEIGATLWRQELKSVRMVAGQADLTDIPLAANERLLWRMGYYASGSLIHEGEIYQGPGRIAHLERRLNARGLGDGNVHYDLLRRWHESSDARGAAKLQGRLDVYFSLSCPYSYLAFEWLALLRRQHALDIRLFPLPNIAAAEWPRRKARFILADAAREAQYAGIKMVRAGLDAFPADDYALTRGMAMVDEEAFDFYLGYMRLRWGGRRYKKHVRSSNLLDTQALSLNRSQLLGIGGWGTPTFRLENGQIFWGQDSLWAALDGMESGGVLSQDGAPADMGAEESAP